MYVYNYFEKGCRKNVHATIPKGNMGYDQYTVPHTAAVEPTLPFGIVACTFSDNLSRNS